MNSTPLPLDERLLHRVYGEFREMPGLRLTARQAQRLWGLDEPTCAELLRALVDAHFLCLSDRGMYARPSDEQTARPRSRMLRATIGGDGTRAKEAV